MHEIFARVETVSTVCVCVCVWWGGGTTESRAESAELRLKLGFHSYVVAHRRQCVARLLGRVDTTRLVPGMSGRRQDAAAQSPPRRGSVV